MVSRLHGPGPAGRQSNMADSCGGGETSGQGRQAAAVSSFTSD